MPEKLQLLTRRFRLSPISPDMVSDDWIGWINDPALMAPLNMRARKFSRDEMGRHVAAAWKGGRAVFGIYLRAGGNHVGLYEAALDRRNGNVTIDVLVDQHRHGLADVLAETDPVFLDFLARKHGVAKAVVQIVETYEAAIRYYEVADWQREGVLRQERRAVAGDRHLDVLQFGRLLIPA